MHPTNNLHTGLHGVRILCPELAEEKALKERCYLTLARPSRNPPLNKIGYLSV